MGEYMCTYTCHDMHVEIRGQLARAISLFLPCVTIEENSGHQSLLEVPFHRTIWRTNTFWWYFGDTFGDILVIVGHIENRMTKPHQLVVYLSWKDELCEMKGEYFKSLKGHMILISLMIKSMTLYSHPKFFLKYLPEITVNRYPLYKCLSLSCVTKITKIISAQM